VTDETTYPAALGRRLDPERFETLNGGMPGFGSLDFLDYFVYKGVELRPDVVVILAGWNDYARAQPLDTRAKPTPRSPLDRSAFFRLTREALLRLYRPPPFDLTRDRARLAALPVPTDRLDDTVFAKTERVLEDLVRLCRVHRCSSQARQTSGTPQGDLAPQCRDLMTEHHDLRVLGRLAAAEQHKPAETKGMEVRHERPQQPQADHE